MTQDTDKCRDIVSYTPTYQRELLMRRVCPCLSGRVIMASTRGIRVRFDPFGEICCHSSQYAPGMHN